MGDTTLKQLRSLAATVHAGTIAGAAKQLHVTPPAVAQQLRLLERGVGMALVQRTDRGLHPTDAGRELLATTARIEAELTSCDRLLDALRDGRSGTLVFGAVSTAKYFAPQLLAAFWATHREVDIRLVIGNRDETVRSLTDFELDLAIMGRPPAELDLVVAPIGEHPHVIIASPRHSLAGSARITQRRLGDETFLVREHGSGTRSLAERFFATAGIEPRIGMEIASNETIKQAVIADLGIALISAHTVAAEIEDGRLVVVNVAGFPIVREWFVVRRPSKRLGPAGELFWEFLADCGAAHFP